MFTAQLLPPSAVVEAEILDYLNRQFRDIEASMLELRFGGIAVVYKVPDKPREGMFTNADGTVWNPGAGAGIYVYHNSTWKKVHA